MNVAQQGTQADGAATAGAAATAAAAAAASDAAATASLQASAAVSAAKLKAAQPLVYRVRRGDTLSHIAQHHHCSVKQLLAWNHLKPSTRLKLGQVLHVASPEAVKEANAAAAAASTIPTNTPAPSAAQTRQVDAAISRHAERVVLAWPAQGNVIEGFQAGETRGIEIGGKPGDPVLAAADGKVMYAGTGLNEYGSLIIVQHNKDFLTAYSHNRKLLVKTGDIVRQGQEIAEMGDENNSRVSVLFEVRRDGKPVDPMPYLPSRQG